MIYTYACRGIHRLPPLYDILIIQKSGVRAEVTWDTEGMGKEIDWIPAFAGMTEGKSRGLTGFRLSPE